MLSITNKDWQGKALVVVAALYLPFLLSLSMLTGHLQRLGDASLFFSSTDAQGYKEIADYYTSLGHSEWPSDYLLSLRPFLFPLYLGLYKVIGIAGVQVLQMILNVASLWLVCVSTKALSHRSWIAVICTLVLALTPSFNFLVFHGLTESLSMFLICLFIALIVKHFKNNGRSELFIATLVVSLLLCIRPIILPFWIVCVGYYFIWSLRNPGPSLWRPAISVAPVLVQLLISFLVSGTATLSSAGGTVFSNWYFPAVYLEKEYGRFLGRKSPEAQEGQERFPQLTDKVRYLASNYKEALYTYAQILIIANLMAGSSFATPTGRMDEDNRAVLYLQKWSVYLNRAFLGLHAAMLGLLVSLIVWGKRIFGQKAMLVCYVFAVLLILPAGLTYLQGDRYIVVAEPLWLAAHAALVVLFMDFLNIRNEAKSQGIELNH